MIETHPNKVTCKTCGEIFEFDDDGSTDCMPDGVFYLGWWYCDECDQKWIEKEEQIS